MCILTCPAEEGPKIILHVLLWWNSWNKKLSRIWFSIYLSIISLPTECSTQLFQKMTISLPYHIIKLPITECVIIIFFYAFILGQALQHKFKENRIFLEKGLSIFERIHLIRITLKCTLEICSTQTENSSSGISRWPKSSTPCFPLSHKLDPFSDPGLSRLCLAKQWHLTGLLHKIPSLLCWWQHQK